MVKEIIKFLNINTGIGTPPDRTLDLLGEKMP